MAEKPSFERFLNVRWPKNLPRDCMNPEKDCIVDGQKTQCNPCVQFSSLASEYGKIHHEKN